MIYIIIPVFNRKKFTKDCLISLERQSFKDFKVIVVDDGSTDGTSEMIASEFPDVEVLFGDGNLWWTASVNLGIRHALEKGAECIMTLNNDVVAPEKFMEMMSHWHKQKPDALLGALALDIATDRPVYGGERIIWKTNTHINLLKQLPKEEQKGLNRVTHFPGRGLLIPKKVFDTIGLFAVKEFPHYYADYDFTCQANKKGFEIYCNYDAPLYTYPNESGDFKNRVRKTFRNYYNHLFGIKGGGNIINFTRFALRNCPVPFIPGYLFTGYARRIFGYLIK
jgi:GT2 family glycosyltransferase